MSHHLKLNVLGLSGLSTFRYQTLLRLKGLTDAFTFGVTISINVIINPDDYLSRFIGIYR